MTQRDKWLIVGIFILAFATIVVLFAVALDDDPKPPRTPAPLPTAVQCDPIC